MIDTLYKQPNESRLFGMPFKNKLVTGEVISSVDSAVATPAGLTVAVDSYSKDVVNILVSGGTNNIKYKVTVTVTGSKSQVLENEGFIEIKEI